MSFLGNVKNNLSKKIRNYTLTLGLLSAMSSCETLDNLVQRDREPVKRETAVTPSVFDYRALQILGVEHMPSFAIELPEGYLTTESNHLRLRYLAAIKSGNTTFDEREIIYTRGRWNPALESEREDYLKVLQRADSNGDRIITREEVNNLERIMRGEYK